MNEQIVGDFIMRNFDYKKLNEEGFIDKHGEGKGSFYVQKSESIW